ncbi:MAG: hypothetical protein HY264_05455, partial [Chloroflexi bacterium]|nr:hypothetical protein [Chloroflexota bacterium]
MSRKELVLKGRRLRYRTELVALLVFVLTAGVILRAPRAENAQADNLDLSGVSLVFDIPAGCFNALCDDGSLSTGSKLGEDSAPIVICGQIPCPPGGEPGFLDIIRTNDSWAAWRPLQDMAIAELATLHAVPVDPGRMKTWDRAEIKAMILANLVAIIDKPASERTQADKVAYDRVARLIKAERLAIAQRAKQEYDAWARSGGCNWSVPPGFAAVPRSPNCLGAPAVAVDFNFSPTAEQFTEYATYYRYTDKLGPFGADALKASKDLAIALGALGGLVAAAAAGIAAWGIATAAGVAFSAFAFSAGLTATTAIGAAAVAAAPAVSAASIGGLVAIALAGAVLVVIASIEFAENLQVPGKLDEAIAE